MPESLAYQTGPSGERFLISSGDGKSLATKAGCENCCGNCLAYYKANPCGPITAPVDPCDPSGTVPDPPPPIYVNSLVECFGRPIRPGDTVVVDGRCYTISDERYKRATDTCSLPPIPPDARIVDQVDDCAADGCRDAKCIVFTSPWGTAEQCDPTLDPGPPVFFCRRIATQCVYVPISPDGVSPPRCYKISPAAAGGVPGSRSLVISSISGGVATCCECTSQLTGREMPCFRCVTLRQTQTAGTPPTNTLTYGPDCCFDRRANCTMRVTGRYFIGDPLGNSELWEIDPQTIPCTGGNVYARITRTENGQSLPPVVQLAEVYQNGGERRCPPLPPLAGTFTFTDTWSYDIRQDCKGTRITASSPQSPGLPPTTLTGSVEYNHAAGSAPCAGGCAGSGPPLPVPFAQWPSAAKLLSLSKQPGEVGLGDTIERLAGKTGAAFKATAKALNIDCGCDARKASYNAIYQY